ENATNQRLERFPLHLKRKARRPFRRCAGYCSHRARRAQGRCPTGSATASIVPIQARKLRMAVATDAMTFVRFATASGPEIRVLSPFGFDMNSASIYAETQVA